MIIYYTSEEEKQFNLSCNRDEYNLYTKLLSKI